MATMTIVVGGNLTLNSHLKSTGIGARLYKLTISGGTPNETVDVSYSIVSSLISGSQGHNIELLSGFAPGGVSVDLFPGSSPITLTQTLNDFGFFSGSFQMSNTVTGSDLSLVVEIISSSADGLPLNNNPMTVTYTVT